MDPIERIYQEQRDIWGDFNEQQQFEHQLIDRKATWSLTTQAVLFAAYGSVFSENPVTRPPSTSETFSLRLGSQ